MTKKNKPNPELVKKFDELCDKRRSCDDCPCVDTIACTEITGTLTDADIENAIKILEDAEDVASEPSADFDVVSKPKHYASTSIECIDAMSETQGVEATKQFCICNAFKYLWRHNAKNGDEDIRKASWYLNKAVSLMEGEST